ncbi:MAG: ribosome assembly factor SBDS [Candidatus Altiarchaeota archaeon]|nr:ribosome assembly factor SBDS [Candidatus Altiarchaeota archaeon]
MTLENSVIARYEKAGDHFEILIDPKGAHGIREGEIPKERIGEFLEVDLILKDARKGDKASEETVKKVFGTNNVTEVAVKILLEGEIQLTTDQRRELLEKREQKIVQAIARDAVDPRTNKPHPPDRIKNALKDAHFNVDLRRDFKAEVQDAIKLLRPVLPLKFEQLKIAIRIPAEYSPKAYIHIHHYTVLKEEWQKDGSLVAVIEIPAGLQDQLYGELNEFTHGNVETRVLKNE